jgi:hypothetical protein
MHRNLMIHPLLLRPPLPLLDSSRIIVNVRVLLASPSMFGTTLKAVGTLD